MRDLQSVQPRPRPGNCAPRKHNNPIGDAQRDIGILFDHDTGNARLPEAPDDQPSRRRRFSVQGPGSARRTARARAEPSNARAMATICISPPDKVSASRAIRYLSGVKISVTSPRDHPRNVVRFSPNDRFFATVSVGQRRRSSGTQPMPAHAI